MKCRYVILIVMLSFYMNQVSFSQSSNPVVAVLNFESQGISNNEINSLTYYFQGELVNTQAFIVLERRDVEKVLKEIGFQQTGCTGTMCAVRAGEMLNAQKVIYGTIGRIGKSYTININFTDVQTSQIEKSFNRGYKGQIEGLMLILKSLAREMAGEKIRGLPPLPSYILGSSAIASTCVTAYFLYKVKISYDEYTNARYADEVMKYKNDTKEYTKNAIYSAAIAGGTTILYQIYRHSYKKSQEAIGITSIYSPDSKTFSVALKLNF